MADVVVAIKDKLVTAGVGTFGATSGWSIAISKEPAAPDTCVTIYPTGGESPNPKFLLDYPSVQVRVRGSEGGYTEAQGKAQKIKDVLLGADSQTVGSDRWVSCLMNGDILLIGYDDNNRPLFVLNFRFIIEPATNADTRRIAI